ncbi:MAG: YitT family protein [Anaerolineales bacterium]|nr:YitT family protein [Anaerolineales bacterium]MCS7246629.1 YitT family protein [Anaerolineales bacterium]MDW8160439.1 YitT family protein [Anaerolineales bacterium]MDW8447778.1 YitT family protein [Anaerolineales bacterium]
MEEKLKLAATLSWRDGRDGLLILAGVFIQALAMRLFLIPARLASGGVAGLAQIINYFTQWPIGVMVVIGNIPLFVLGWRYLGGLRFALRTVFAVGAFSVLVDVLAFFLPAEGITRDLNLNALYGGVISGIGFGLVYRGQGTSGGSDILARILNHRWGISLSQSYMLTDALIMFLAGISFSWEHALYAIVMLYISGVAAEVTLEGSNVTRTAMIISERPEEILQKILFEMKRGVTLIPGQGGFSGRPKTVLYCVVSRSEIAQVKALVREADPEAFMVIGQATEVFGEGFKPLTEPTPTIHRGREEELSRFIEKTE